MTSTDRQSNFLSMKLIIYETTHYENLPAILDLAIEKCENISVFLDDISFLDLCTDIQPKNKWPGVHFICRKETTGNRSFIRLMFAYAVKNGYTHLHISTLSNNYLFFAWKLILNKKIQTSLTVHEINLYRKFYFSGLRDLTECLAKIYLHRRIKRYRGLIPRMKDELQKYFPSSGSVFIPSRFYSQSNTNTKDNHSFQIVIPGSIDKSRRDYLFLEQFVQNHLIRMSTGYPVELIFLGSYESDYGREFISGLTKITKDLLRIVSYPDHVSAAEYQLWLNRANVIFSPIRVSTIGSRGQREIYGITKSPGITADLILYKKITFVPAAFLIPKYLKNAMVSYDNEIDLLNKMSETRVSDIDIRIQKIDKDLSELIPENFDQEFQILMQKTKK